LGWVNKLSTNFGGNMKFQIGVIGATGYIGTPYRKEIRESEKDASILALCARRQDRLEAAGTEDDAELITGNWQEVVEHPQVNLVVVATPDALHHEAVMACAEQQKHMLCEKPVGVNVGEAHEMWSAYRGTNLAHFVPFWTRYVPAFVRAREIFRAGTLGEIRAISYRWHNPRPAAMPFTWRDDAALSSAGSLGDVGSHAYDTLRWILGQDAVRVLAHADVITPTKPDLGAVNLDEALDWSGSHRARDSSNVRKGTAYDYADVAFVLENGAVASLVLSHAPYLRKGLAPELELHGTEASLAIDRNNGTLTLARPDEEARILETVPNPGFGNRFSKHVFPAMRAQLAGEECEFPGLEDGWRVQLFTDAAALSADRGSWVELAELDPECS
jgi:predicted dehydrogenase